VLDYFLNISKLIICWQIKPAEYMGIISSLRPNLWATLADEVPAWVSKKRNKNSVDRTVKWLDECVALSPVKIISFSQVKLV
jgi:queuine tRNA-ribosyltransferase subunit QTRTD1